jgi:hypothetical protein
MPREPLYEGDTGRFWHWKKNSFESKKRMIMFNLFKLIFIVC